MYICINGLNERSSATQRSCFFELALQNAEICATDECCATGTLPSLQLQMIQVTPPITCSSGKNASMFKAVPEAIPLLLQHKEQKGTCKGIPKADLRGRTFFFLESSTNENRHASCTTSLRQLLPKRNSAESHSCKGHEWNKSSAAVPSSCALRKLTAALHILVTTSESQLFR